MGYCCSSYLCHPLTHPCPLQEGEGNKSLEQGAPESSGVTTDSPMPAPSTEGAVQEEKARPNGTEDSLETDTGQGPESAVDTVDADKAMADVNGDAPEVAAPMLSEADKELADKFKSQVKDRMKERDDLFDEMVVHEEQIQLGAAGWKARYYQVCPVSLIPAVAEPVNGGKVSTKQSTGLRECTTCTCWLLVALIRGEA